jgi:hypothetical protein
MITVLYYTANREAEIFENRIQQRLLQSAKDLPIISVSQKPINLGENICVGDVGVCYANQFRQMLIGAEAVKTPLIACAEADCLYPPEYFEFRPDPKSGHMWRYTNVWIMWRQSWMYGKDFRRKEYSEGAQVIGRNYLIKRLSRALAGRPEWSNPGDPHPPEVYRKRRWFTFGGPECAAVISVKSGWGVNPSTGTMRTVTPAEKLPYWGDADKLRRELFA